MTIDQYIRECPSCGQRNDSEPYDIGDGPELSCPNCEWCWGALGQDLTAKPVEDLRRLAERMDDIDDD